MSASDPLNSADLSGFSFIHMPHKPPHTLHLSQVSGIPSLAHLKACRTRPSPMWQKIWLWVPITYAHPVKATVLVQQWACVALCFLNYQQALLCRCFLKLQTPWKREFPALVLPRSHHRSTPACSQSMGISPQEGLLPVVRVRPQPHSH